MAAAVNSFYGVDGNASRISEKVVAANNLRNDIEERNKTGFTDDPIAWLENIFIKAHERDQLGDLEKDITYNNARAKDAYELRSLAIPSITAQQALAKAKFDAAQTQSDVADASTAYAKVNTQHAATTFAHAVSTVATEGEAASREMALAKEKYTVQLQAILNADTAAKYSFQVVQLMENLEERQELVGVSLRRAEANLDLPKGTLLYNTYKALSTDEKAYYMGAAVGRLGFSPGQAGAATTRVMGKNLPVMGPDAPAINKALLQLNQKWRDDALLDPKMKEITTPEGRDGFIAEFINKKWKYAEDNPESNPGENPFPAISPQALDKATGGALSKSPVGKILQPYINSGATVTAEQVISDIHKTAISQDIDPYTESKMIFDYYTANIRARNQGIPFQLYGVDPKPQYIYQTKGTPYLTFTGGLGINPLNEPGRRVNLLNFDDIRRMTIHTHNAETIQRGADERSFQQQKSGIY